MGVEGLAYVLTQAGQPLIPKRRTWAARGTRQHGLRRVMGTLDIEQLFGL